MVGECMKRGCWCEWLRVVEYGGECGCWCERVME
jgi:hypothetical protein